MALDDVMTGFGAHQFPLPAIAGRFAGRRAVVCGDAACLWADLEAFGCADRSGRGSVRRDGWDFVVINRVAETFPGEIAHAYSNEPWLLDKFIAARRHEYSREFGGIGATHSCNKGAQWRWPWGGYGSSGLGAALVAIGLGYAPVVLAGMPLDDGPHNGEPPWRKCTFQQGTDPKQVNSHWRRAMDLAFEGRVTSLSGRTRQWLGSPSS